MKIFLFVFCAVFVVISAEFPESYNSQENSGSYNYPVKDYSSEQNYGDHENTEHDEKSHFSQTTYGDNYAGEIKDDDTTNSNSHFNFPSNSYGKHYSEQSYTGGDANYNYPSSSYDYNSGHEISDSKYSYPGYGYNYGSGQYFTGQSNYNKFNFPSTSTYGGHGSGQLLSENIEVFCIFFF